MKKFLMITALFTLPLLSFAAAKSDNFIFRAMQDEMHRTLKELHLPGELKPYYVSYHVEEDKVFYATASLGTVALNWDSAETFTVTTLLKIGDNKNNNTGYADDSIRGYSRFTNAAGSYEGIRQALWNNSNNLYLEALEQYKKKEAYRREKHIQDKLPDVIPAAQGTYIEETPAWNPPERKRIEEWLKKVSAYGKKIDFVEEFDVNARQERKTNYDLNSRGAKSQYTMDIYRIEYYIFFRQPDGYEEEVIKKIYLKDFSEQELQQADEKIQQFLKTLQARYGAPEAEVYLGPVLYKPVAAFELLHGQLLSSLGYTVPFWGAFDEDPLASPWRKKVGKRVTSLGINIYDRPQEKTYQGIALVNFRKIDWEGVPAQTLTLVQDGHLKDLPFSQRPLSKKEHKSNGHAFLLESGGVREGLSSVFVEIENPLTDEQLEQKLLDRCKELKLDYCYINHGDAFERIYTEDGHKEWVVGLEEVNTTPRSLRDIIAAGGAVELVERQVVTPSLLVDEVELEPKDRKPNRKPLVKKPE